MYYQYFIRLSDNQLSEQIDLLAYDENELIEIKVPMALPYNNNSDRYEKVEGEIELEGIHYNFIKRKIATDTVYLMCLPNKTKTKLVKDKINYATQANELPGNSKDNNAKKNAFSNEYIEIDNSSSLQINIVTVPKQYIQLSSTLLMGHSLNMAKPPEPLS